MSQLDAIHGFDDHFMRKPDDFRAMFDSSNPHEHPLPEPWHSRLTQFERIIALKAIRPDKVIPAVQNWIASIMGERFIVFPPLELAKSFKDSNVTTPLIFVLSAGSDPVADFLRFAEEMGMSKRFESISLGQGQGEKAQKLIRESIQKGGWVLLQNVIRSLKRSENI